MQNSYNGAVISYVSDPFPYYWLEPSMAHIIGANFCDPVSSLSGNDWGGNAFVDRGELVTGIVHYGGGAGFIDQAIYVRDDRAYGYPE